MLSNLLRLVPDEPADPTPEDIFSSALSTLFPDDLIVQHGDATTTIVYRSTRYGDIHLRCADVFGEEERRKFAHYLWNSGVIMAEFVGGPAGANDSGPRPDVVAEHGEEFGRRTFPAGTNWWLSDEEQQIWETRGHTVLELGAGTFRKYRGSSSRFKSKAYRFAGVGIAGIISAIAGAKEVGSLQCRDLQASLRYRRSQLQTIQAKHFSKPCA
jgi:nicotinamide N-methyltransferase